VKMEIPKGNAVCMRCHTKNAASPSGIIKQIDAVEHSEGEDCINCHNPHQPWL
jgi:nitrate/TMAO reductase-like tetraheme cytochrome c subunit